MPNAATMTTDPLDLQAPSTSISAPSLIPGLTGARFFLALFVVVFHFGQPDVAPYGTIARNFAGSGYVSVSLFFLLSGYVIGCNYLRDEYLERVKFWIARFARIAPAYWTAMAASIPLFLYMKLFYSPMRHENLFVTIATALTCSQAWFFKSSSLWNFPAWSLSCEWFFYLLFPFVAPLLVRLDPMRLRLTIFGLALVSMLPPLVYFLWLPDGVPFHQLTQASVAQYSAIPGVYEFQHLLTRKGLYGIFMYNPLMHLPMFLLGAGLGRYKVAFAEQRITLSSRIAVHTALLVMLGFLANSGSMPHLLLHNGLIALCFSGFIFYVEALWTPLAFVLMSPPIVLLGEASYALYILQAPLNEWYETIVRHLHLIPAKSSDLPATLLIGFLVFLCAASVLTYLCVERPCRKWLRRSLTRLLISQRIASPNQ
jgi:peptidoglycan/LPS O-acetylase OafA/YrhL